MYSVFFSDLVIEHSQRIDGNVMEIGLSGFSVLDALYSNRTRSIEYFHKCAIGINLYAEIVVRYVVNRKCQGICIVVFI